MARSKSAAAAEPVEIDATSGDVVLEYQGGRTGRYVPARDLSGNDLARIAYRRAADVARATRSRVVEVDARKGERPTPTRPGPATAEELEQLAADLIATGRFARNIEPAASGAPAPEPEVPSSESQIEPPGEPAPEPEG